MTAKERSGVLKRLTPFRGRRTDIKAPVDVYRNLARGGYSVRQRGCVALNQRGVFAAYLS